MRQKKQYRILLPLVLSVCLLSGCSIFGWTPPKDITITDISKKQEKQVESISTEAYVYQT